jgi:hypothetical protein
VRPGELNAIPILDSKFKLTISEIRVL